MVQSSVRSDANVRRRRVEAALWWGLSLLAVGVLLAILVFIFGFVVVRGLPAVLRLTTYTTITSGTGGGLANAIVGTLVLVLMGGAFAVVLGVSAGIYTANYASPRLAAALRIAVDVLAGVPSIVVGYFGYIVLVVDLSWHFSLLAGAFALAIIMLPYIVRASDLAFSGVPRELTEGAYALGSTKNQVLATIAFPIALPGALTGVLLGGGIALGETAPLIYTAGWSNYLPDFQLTHSAVGYLTYVVWTFIGEPFESAHELAYGAAVLLILAVFFVNVVARIALERYARTMKGTRG
jgi:phosphate transport system permease protein